jgi:cytochrome P450
MFDLLAELIDTERARPTDTPLGRLVKLEKEGEKISTAELVSLVGLMYMAGFGTTMRTLGNAVVAFIRNPDQAAALRADPSRTRAATEEILRYDPPVMTVGYFVGDGAVAGDRPLAPGTQCTVVLGASNQDPTVFDRPAAFDITAARTDPPLSFGYGTHFCLGSNLTKLEVDVVVSELVRRFPRMELAEKPQRKPSFRSREFVRVPVVLEPGG